MRLIRHGAEFFGPVLQAVEENSPVLRHVDLNVLNVHGVEDGFDDERATELGRSIRHNTYIQVLELSLSQLQRIPIDLLHFIEHSTSLKGLKLSYGWTPGITNRFIKAAKKSRSLTSLSLESCRISKHLLAAYLQSSTTLKTFEIRLRDDVGYKWMWHYLLVHGISQNRSIQSLKLWWLPCSHGKTEPSSSFWYRRRKRRHNAMIDALVKRTTHLQELHIAGSTLDASSMLSLIRAVQTSSTMRYLALRDQSEYDLHNLIQSISQVAHTEGPFRSRSFTLDLRDNNIVLGWDDLHSNTVKDHDAFVGRHWSLNSLIALSSKAQIESLHLSYCGLYEEHFLALSQWIRGSHYLQYLDFTGNIGLTSTSLRALFVGLADSTVRRLDLTVQDEDEMNGLTSSLLLYDRNSIALRSLKLNGLDDTLLIKLFGCLQEAGKKQFLERIDIREDVQDGALYTDFGLRLLAVSLPNIQGLQELRLSITIEPSDELIQSFLVNISLTPHVGSLLLDVHPHLLDRWSHTSKNRFLAFAENVTFACLCNRMKYHHNTNHGLLLKPRVMTYAIAKLLSSKEGVDNMINARASAVFWALQRISRNS